MNENIFFTTFATPQIYDKMTSIRGFCNMAGILIMKIKLLKN